MTVMTTTFAKEIMRFLRSEEGPTSMEYAFMIMLALVAVFASVQLLGETTSDRRIVPWPVRDADRHSL
jgi:Flp pilus assembly pilin Flp